MTSPHLEVRDHGDLLRFSFEDLVKYSGRSSIGGVAHGFKVLERALPLLDGGAAPDREDISIESAFGGGGARDAFEMVTRAVTGDRFRVDAGLAPDGPPSPMGQYFFRFSHRTGAVVDLTLRPGLVLDEFVELAKRGPSNPAEEDRLAALKQQMADLLMSLPAAAVYDAELLQP
ncbi:MAG TPA: hypothetical protein VGR20_12355 [Acidimicrobiia bacterium]|jgi:hypothetical protein|nr:hypothetical protein [Acidimicrobiia bacterium]